MRYLSARIVCSLVFILSSGASLSAQTGDLRLTVASLSQDLSLVTQEVRTLRLEIEDLRRQNRQLETQLRAASNDQQVSQQIANLSAAIDSLRQEYRAADQAQQQSIIAEVNTQLESLAKQTEGALSNIAKVRTPPPPPVESRPHFTSDYPKTGISYTVRSGDTLSQIARKHQSTVKHIQSANQIVNPARDLRVGETIFIPVAE